MVSMGVDYGDRITVESLTNTTKVKCAELTHAMREIHDSMLDRQAGNKYNKQLVKLFTLKRLDIYISMI